MYNNDNFIIETKKTAKTLSHKMICLSFLFFFFCVNGTHSFMAVFARYFMSADFTSHDICLTSVTIQIWGPVHRVKSNHIKQVRNSVLSGLGISFQNLNLLHFDQIISLKSLSIHLFLLARLNLGLQLMRPWVQASQKALCSEKKERERERKKERERRLFKPCQNLSAWHCAVGVQLFKWCCNLSACTVLQGCSCLSSVAT